MDSDLAWTFVMVAFVAILSVIIGRIMIDFFKFLSNTPMYAAYICFKGSKSFFFASLFYPSQVRNRIFIFYCFARLCDDLIDDPSNLDRSQTEQNCNIKFITKMLDYCYNNNGNISANNKDSKDNRDYINEDNDSDKMESILSSMSHIGLFATKVSDDNNENEYLFTKDIIGQMLKDLTFIIKECQIPRYLFELLLFGFKLDVQKYECKNSEDLYVYCVCVASSIGLICSYLYKSEPINDALLSKAASLGIAFQLTNIARDIITDIKELNKIYIPETWMNAKEISLFNEMKFYKSNNKLTQLNELIESNRNGIIRQFSLKLIKIAEIYYNDAWNGVSLLPKGVHLAIFSALLIYREIGMKILQSDKYPNRSYVSFKEKIGFLYHSYYQIKPKFEPIDGFTLKSTEMMKLAIDKSKYIDVQ